MKKGGIISTVIVFLLVASVYYVFHYTELFSKTDNYYSSFTKVSGLQESAAVLLHGVKVGSVSDIFLDKDRNIHVTYDIRKGVTIPEGTIAEVINGDVAGTKAVSFTIGSGKKYLSPGSFIPTIPDTTFIELFNAKISPLLNGGIFLIRTADSSLHDLNFLINYGGIGRRVQEKVRLFNQDLSGMAQTASDASSQVSQLSKSINNLSDLLNNPSQTKKAIDQKITSGTSTMHDFSQKDYDSLLQGVGNSVKNAADKMVAQADEMELLKDKKLYRQANFQLDTAKAAMQELQNDPPGIRLIGSSKKKK